MNAYIDISNVILQSDRIILRAWKQSDLDDFFEYASVPGVGEMAGWEHHKNRKVTQTVLDNFIEKKKI